MSAAVRLTSAIIFLSLNNIWLIYGWWYSLNRPPFVKTEAPNWPIVSVNVGLGNPSLGESDVTKILSSKTKLVG